MGMREGVRGKRMLESGLVALYTGSIWGISIFCSKFDGRNGRGFVPK